jgi:hypothetical protein
MTIAYLPVEIDVRLPDEQEIIDYVKKYQIPSMTHLNGPRFDPWIGAPVMGRAKTSDWYDPEKFKEIFCNRLVPNTAPIEYANNIDEKFPELIYMINQLPMKETSVVMLLMQTRQVTAHTDNQPDDVILDPSWISIDTEPRRYNIQLTRHGVPSFFVSKTNDSEKIYPSITKEMPCFLSCEQHHYHGADFVVEGKIMMCVLGIVDKDRHVDNIRKNLEKYQDQAIIFPD